MLRIKKHPINDHTGRKSIGITRTSVTISFVDFSHMFYSGSKIACYGSKNTSQFFSLIFRTFYPKLKRGGVHFCVDCEETPAERRASSQSTQKRTPPIQQMSSACTYKEITVWENPMALFSVTFDILHLRIKRKTNQIWNRFWSFSRQHLLM